MNNFKVEVNNSIYSYMELVYSYLESIGSEILEDKSDYEFLGTGSYANVFGTDKYSFKFTNDSHDAIMSYKVKGCKTNHIVEVYEVVNLKNCYCIIA